MQLFTFKLWRPVKRLLVLTLNSALAFKFANNEIATGYIMDFLANLFSLGSISTSRHGLSILLGVIAAALTAWGWGADSGWLVFFGQVVLVLAAATEGYGAVSAGAAGIIVLVYFTQSILFVEAVRKTDELEEIYANCVPNAQGELPEACPLLGK